MKYKVGDRVRIKSLDWYNENKGNADKTNSVWCADGGVWFFYHMSQYCGKIITIENVWANSYTLEGSDSRWTDEMIEGLVEDEMIDLTSIVMETVEEKTIQNALAYGYNLPDGYQFKDENGNVINATKIVLEKKKKEYPKTYEECCKELNIPVRDLDILDNMLDTTEIIYSKNIDRLLNSFRKLLICRDAYWKIAGDWKPDYDSGVDKFGICTYDGVVQKSNAASHWERHLNKVLEFPTKEMRDAFCENFKELINECKELL